MLEVLGGAHQLIESYENLKVQGKGGGDTMCEMLDRTIAEGVAEGIAKELPQAVAKEVAKAEAKTEALHLVEYINNLQKNLNCSIEKALQAIGKTPEEYKQATLLLNNL